MIELSKLIKLQWVFAAASLAYLTASTIRAQITGEPLSAAPIGPSIMMFLVYGACLLLPRFGRIKSYRGAMMLAVVRFGGGGVIGNIARYMDTGLEQYATLGAYILAVAINAYGTVLNILAALGLFEQTANDRSGSGPVRN